MKQYRIKINKEEHLHLLEVAGFNRSVRTTFGPNGVNVGICIIDEDENVFTGFSDDISLFSADRENEGKRYATYFLAELVQREIPQKTRLAVLPSVATANRVKW